MTEREVSVTQWCPTCQRTVQARLHLKRRQNMLIADRSECLTCHSVLWSWSYDTDARTVMRVLEEERDEI